MRQPSLPVEVHADPAALQGGRRPHVLVAGGVRVVVVDAEEKGIGRLPREAQRHHAQDALAHGTPRASPGAARRRAPRDGRLEPTDASAG